MIAKEFGSLKGLSFPPTSAQISDLLKKTVTIIEFFLRLCLEPGGIRGKPLFTAEIFSIPLPLPLTVFFLNQNRYRYRLPRVPKILTAKPLFRNSNTVTVTFTAKAVLPPAVFR